MADISEMILSAEAELARSGIPEPGREARSLLARVLGQNRAFLYSHPEYVPDDGELERFESFVARRAGHEPFQYIVGVQEFYGLDFEVTPAVLIPRPETEMLTERAIRYLNDCGGRSVCEVGVGSGCILVSILSNVNTASGKGIDISADAIEVARRNAERHGVASRISFIVSDVFDGLSGEKFDLIVSNPPYVPAGHLDGLQAEVRDHEPLGALTDGGDGLGVIRKISELAPQFLRPNGRLLMEIGFDQSAAVDAMLAGGQWKQHEIVPDFQGIPRMVDAQI